MGKKLQYSIRISCFFVHASAIGFTFVLPFQSHYTNNPKTMVGYLSFPATLPLNLASLPCEKEHINFLFLLISTVKHMRKSPTSGWKSEEKKIRGKQPRQTIEKVPSCPSENPYMANMEQNKKIEFRNFIIFLQ